MQLDWRRRGRGRGRVGNTFFCPASDVSKLVTWLQLIPLAWVGLTLNPAVDLCSVLHQLQFSPSFLFLPFSSVFSFIVTCFYVFDHIKDGPRSSKHWPLMEEMECLVLLTLLVKHYCTLPQYILLTVFSSIKNDVMKRANSSCSILRNLQ